MHSGVTACINILIECRVRTFLMFKIRKKKKNNKTVSEFCFDCNALNNTVLRKLLT